MKRWMDKRTGPTWTARINEIKQFTRAVCKVRGLTLLLRVGTLWRCGDGLFVEVPPLASDSLLTTLHPLLENGVTVVLKESFIGWRSNLSGTLLEHPSYSPELAPCDFWTFPTTKRELRGQNRLFHHPPEACGKLSKANTFSRSGWSVVRSAPLAKRGTMKKRPSLHVHKVPTRRNKVSPRTSWNGPRIWVRECIQKFPDWPPRGARTANDTALCH
jgi:hypothetical protein